MLAVSRNADWNWAITSEDEWYKAAYHDNDGVTGSYFDYPTGGDIAPGRDMSEATSPGNNANHYGDPYPIQSPHYSTVAGEFELSNSPYDTFDQGGNVWEWNEAIIGSHRGLRGGSFSNSAVGVVSLCASHRYSNSPANEVYWFGFRVSAVPEPGTMGILALGGIGLLRRQKGVRRWLSAF